MKTPEIFVMTYNGKAIDFDGAYGVQCVDGFKVGCVYIDIPPQPCPNNLAESYWTCKNADGSINQNTKNWQEKYFDLIDDFRQFRNGDWVVWPRGCKSHPSSHVAMYYNGQEFGERQYEDNRAFCLKNTDFSDASGALRPKLWTGIPEWNSDLTINGHLYHLYRQAGHLKAVVLSPGLNKVAPIRDLDCDFNVYAKLTGCNLYQSKTDIPDQPYGTTYGDISSPICGVYQNLPNQDSTMFYDLETGEHADCTGINIDPEHNVFSPVLIYEPGKNVQYARMVGLDHCNYVSRYGFTIRFTDGTYALGLAEQDLTPNQIANDLISIPGVKDISFIDGGSSAGMMRYLMNEGRVEYLKTTDTAAGCIALIGGPVKPQQPADGQEPTTGPTQPEEPETGQSEEEDENMSEPIYEEPVKDPEWKDPEPQTNIITERIAALLSVKSILTLALTGVFAWLIVHRAEIPEFFADIYKIVILFFFGYQTGKAEKK